MKKILVFIVIAFIGSINLNAAADWGRTGHRTTGEIAEKYLSKKAKRAINRLLDGHSLAFVANFGDDIKSDPKFNEYRPWHYVNFPFGSEYENSPKSEKGDIIVAINKCIEVLKNPKSSSQEKAFYLKMLVHFMGDLHQPLHIGLAEDKGGNDFQVRWFNDGTNLHTVWDSKMIESYEMSYTELADNTNKLSIGQLEVIKSGTVIDWMYESRRLCEDIYANTEIGEKLGYQYMYKYTDVVRAQLQKGGIRLATLLNEIFG